MPAFSGLPAATTPLGGTEVVVLDQSGVTSQATAQDIADLAAAAIAADTVTALSVSAGVVTIDLSLGEYFTLAPGANVTSMTYSNLPGSGKGFSILIEFTQDTTPRTVVFPTGSVRIGGAGAVSTGSGAKDLIGLTSLDNGSSTIVIFGNALT